MTLELIGKIIGSLLAVAGILCWALIMFDGVVDKHQDNERKKKRKKPDLP